MGAWSAVATDRHLFALRLRQFWLPRHSRRRAWCDDTGTPTRDHSVGFAFDYLRHDRYVSEWSGRRTAGVISDSLGLRDRSFELDDQPRSMNRKIAASPSPSPASQRLKES